jgi:hypothetical protein
MGLSPNGIRLTKAALRSTRELLLASQNAVAEMNVARDRWVGTQQDL